MRPLGKIIRYQLIMCIETYTEVFIKVKRYTRRKREGRKGEKYKKTIYKKLRLNR